MHDVEKCADIANGSGGIGWPCKIASALPLERTRDYHKISLLRSEPGSYSVTTVTLVNQQTTCHPAVLKKQTFLHSARYIYI